MTTPPSPAPRQPVTGWQRRVVIWLDKLIYRFARRWLLLFNLFVAVYVGLPMLAPALMVSGATGPANVIYTLYRPMCHQMASRSFFLFGEQLAYPRANVDTSLTPLDAYIPQLPEFASYSGDIRDLNTFLGPARAFKGNPQMGYKMALCERDIAIYGFVLVGGLVYGLLRRRFPIKPLPLWGFVLLGLAPIGLDGFSQLFSYFFARPLGVPWLDSLIPTLQQIFPLRESPPWLRTLTGGLFGFSLVWLAYPQIEPGMRDTANQLAAKLRRVGAIND